MSLGGGDERSTRRGLLVVALATFVMLGLADGSLGVAWPSMRAAFDRGLSDLGVLLAFLSVGYLTASTGYGRVHSLWTDRSSTSGPWSVRVFRRPR